jgi:signal peptidase I
MARTPTQRPAPRGSGAAQPPAPDRASPRPRESYRDTIEAIAVAFIFALLVRGFEAEAFVIPTGSMAPTLMGRHKEVTCPQCGYVYTVNASEEVEGVLPENAAAHRVYSGTCVNCRYQARVADEPSFKGDRILVMKFPYDMPFLPGSSGPKRWDVIVFHYPEEPEVSYIKRLVGLPGETIHIWYGDIYVRPPGGKDFQLERRPLVHQQAMQMMVYDDAHRARLLKDLPKWRRWESDTPGGWSEEGPDGGTYVAAGGGDDWTELRYRHLVPDPQQWRSLESGDPLPRAPRPTLVTDFYSYNTNLLIGRADLAGGDVHDQDGAWMQPHWVGDLTLKARVAPESGSGALRWELIKGGVSNRCEVDLSTGEAVLYHGRAELGRATSPLKGAGRHDVELANVDDRLTFWVDGRPVFADGLTYQDPGNHPEPTAEDLAPARIGSRGAKVRVSGLVLKRDIYYTQNPGSIDYAGTMHSRIPRTPVELFDLLAEPRQVAELGPLGWTDYTLGEDRFLMLGDNSPRSKDSRGWQNDDMEWDTTGRQRHEVPRSMLTGKAFCIYWPHGVPLWPDFRFNADFRFPFRPYVERMGLIH